jgi:hypothetical protein
MKIKTQGAIRPSHGSLYVKLLEPDVFWGEPVTIYKDSAVGIGAAGWGEARLNWSSGGRQSTATSRDVAQAMQRLWKLAERVMSDLDHAFPVGTKAGMPKERGNLEAVLEFEASDGETLQGQLYRDGTACAELRASNMRDFVERALQAGANVIHFNLTLEV